MENQQGKVLSFRKGNYPIFSPSLRKDLEHGVSSLTEKPSEVVTAIEQVICTTLVSLVRSFAQGLGESVGKKITGTVAKVDFKK